MVINNELFRSWVNYLLFVLYVCVCVCLRCNLEIFPFLFVVWFYYACRYVCWLCWGVYLGVSEQFQLFILFRESVGELSPDDVLFSSRASGKLETEPERDVTFV